MKTKFIGGLAFVGLSAMLQSAVIWITEWWLPMSLCFIGMTAAMFLFSRQKQVEQDQTSDHILGLLAEQEVSHAGVLIDDSNPNQFRYLIKCPPQSVATFENEINGLLSAFRMRLGNARLEIKADYDRGGMMLTLPRPEDERRKVSFEEALEAVGKTKCKLPVPLGLTTSGRYHVTDLVHMPHLLIAGASGSGKSVFILNLLTTWLKTRAVQLVLISPKPTTFAPFKSVASTITDPMQAIQALQALVIEMHRRYTEPGEYPPIVVVIDELAQLMITAKQMRGAAETCLVQLAQMAREAGIFLVVATQRPSTNVITGLIRDNIPGRICFKVVSPAASRMILGEQHSDGFKLRGNGHGYLLAGERLIEFQAPMIQDEEVQNAVQKALRQFRKIAATV